MAPAFGDGFDDGSSSYSDAGHQRAIDCARADASEGVACESARAEESRFEQQCFWRCGTADLDGIGLNGQ